MCLTKRRIPLQKDLGDIRGLIADALQIGNHLQRSGNLTQVARHRLLPQQKAKAARFDCALLLVDRFLQCFDAGFLLTITAVQGKRRHRQRLLAKCAHYQ